MSASFVVLEGLDGSGGTTQAKLLAEWLSELGQDVLLTREPSDGPVGRFIRQALSATGDHAAIGDAVLPYLFAADRRDHLDSIVIPALQAARTVVSDRYYHSSLAYQSLVVGLPAVAALNEPFPHPDLTILLDLAPEACLARIDARGGVRERFEALQRLREVQEAYESVVLFCRSRGERIERIDASPPPDVVHRQVRELVRPLR